MIKEYKNGNELVEENRAFLELDMTKSGFFFLDAPLLINLDERNYVFKVENNGKKLLVLSVEPFNILFYGDKECAKEAAEYINEKGYVLRNYLAEEELGNAFADVLKKFGFEYSEELAMDFMEADSISEPSSAEVTAPTDSDFEELFELKGYFFKDCGLLDENNAERLKKQIKDFRIIRRDGKIASMARMTQVTDRDAKIADVYTRDEYRGKHIARLVVNTLKNEIIESGRIATLNVDQKNPISNHLYGSLGFKKVFSQGEYRQK